jgi:hypothetical protein
MISTSNEPGPADAVEPHRDAGATVPSPGRRVAPEAILALQRAAGNRAVGRMLLARRIGDTKPSSAPPPFQAPFSGPGESRTPLGQPAKSQPRPGPMEHLRACVGNRRAAGSIVVARSPAPATPGLARGVAAPKASRRLAEIAQAAIDELDGGRNRKLLLSAVLAAARLGELPAFAAILKATPTDEVFGDHFIFLVWELNERLGSSIAVGLLQLFADAGVEITGQLNTYTLQPLAAVAEFRSLLKRMRALIASGDLSKTDAEALRRAIADAEAELRAIEEPPRRPGIQVKQAGGVAGAAAAAWRAAAALAADDATVIGIADDVAIPFVIIGAAALSAVALFTGGPKPRVLDYGSAKAKVEAAVRMMHDLVAISAAMAVQGKQAAGQLSNVAVHLARLLVLGSVGGHPPGKGHPPKKNDRDDKKWWKEIKASLDNYFQAFKGASRKQIMRELLKYYTEDQIAEIEAALLRAEELMKQSIGPEAGIGRPLIPPP